MSRPEQRRSGKEIFLGLLIIACSLWALYDVWMAMERMGQGLVELAAMYGLQAFLCAAIVLLSVKRLRKNRRDREAGRDKTGDA